MQKAKKKPFHRRNLPFLKIFSEEDRDTLWKFGDWYSKSSEDSGSVCRGTTAWHNSRYTGRLDQERKSEDFTNMRCIIALQQSSVLAVSPLCLPTLKTETCRECCTIHFPTKPPCSTSVDVLETGDVPI